jgi:hypothetical protein
MRRFTETGFPISNLKGMGASFDKGEGNYLLQQKNKHLNAGFFIPYQKRFCETCNNLKPKGKRKAVKGWKCDDCFNTLRKE